MRLGVQGLILRVVITCWLILVFSFDCVIMNVLVHLSMIFFILVLLCFCVFLILNAFFQPVELSVMLLNQYSHRHTASINNSHRNLLYSEIIFYVTEMERGSTGQLA